MELAVVYGVDTSKVYNIRNYFEERPRAGCDIEANKLQMQNGSALYIFSLSVLARTFLGPRKKLLDRPVSLFQEYNHYCF